MDPAVTLKYIVDLASLVVDLPTPLRD